MKFIYSKNLTDTNEAVKNRLPHVMKKYSSQGIHIPLRQNWSNVWCTLNYQYDRVLDNVYNFETRNDDVFVVTFMKSGTTWMQETAWLLINNLDYVKAKEISLLLRSPYIDFQGLFPDVRIGVDLTNNAPSPRLIKCHMPAQLLPVEIWEKKRKVDQVKLYNLKITQLYKFLIWKNTKNTTCLEYEKRYIFFLIIYVARNVKDVIVSSYHMTLKMGMWKGDNIVDFVEDFLNDDIVFTSYWSHVLNFWKMRHEPFIIFITYEEMKKDMPNVLQRLCTFLERPPLNEEELEQLVKHLSFESMKDNQQTNFTDTAKKSLPYVKEDFQFMRRGIIGSYKDELTPELQKKIDKWSQDILQQHGVTEEEIFGEM